MNIDAKMPPVTVPASRMNARTQRMLNDPIVPMLLRMA